jgi:NTP pyrophosphatase (non-canonical NTP hydrolase)
MNDVNKEIMLITQEECAEVVQAISKVFRFGFSSEHNGVKNSEHLEEELGDLLCMIELMISNGLADEMSVYRAKNAKMAKLAKWSSIV